MRFDLDEQQRAFQAAVTEYLAAECPVSRTLAAHDSGEPDYGIWRGLMELGIGGMTVPAEYGGLGLGLLDLAVVAESVGRFAAPGPFLEHALATVAIELGASDAQKAKWLPALAKGEIRATFACAEQKGSWTSDTWTASAAATLCGSKRFVLHAPGVDLVVAGLEGGHLGLIEGGSRGITKIDVPSTDASRQLSHLTFESVACEIMPHAVGARAIDAGLVLLAADAFGGASRCVALAVDYSKERQQFGQPIGAFQAVKHQLADMALAVEPAIGLYWYAAHAFDSEAADAPLAAALAKSHITEVYPRIARRMIEAHGGIGYTWEYGAHIWLKRALFDQAYLGMPQLHRARAAALAGW